MTLIGVNKLKKESEDLYLEPGNKGQEFRWARKLELLSLDLFDFNHINYASIDSPKYPLCDDYKEERGEIVQAIGIMGDRTVHLIGDDGTIGASFDKVEIALRPWDRSPDDGNAELPLGSLFYMDAEAVRYQGRGDPYMCMEMYIPRDFLDGIVAAIGRQHFRRVRLLTYVNVFQSEVERSLAEPWMRQDYCIEERGSTGAHFNYISVENVVASRHERVHPSNKIDDIVDDGKRPEPIKQQEPIEDVRDLLATFATAMAAHARGVKIALYWILLVLIVANIPW